MTKQGTRVTKRGQAPIRKAGSTATDARGVHREAIGIFAKAPVPGRTKTRLIPLLGEEGAAAFHRAALLDTLAIVRVTRVPFTLFITPASDRSIFEQLSVDPSMLRPQGGGSLGSRMARALTQLLQAGTTERAVLIGTDSPDLPPDRILGALRSLLAAPAALAPAFDGGYTVIGCQKKLAANHDLRTLFAKVPWSTSETLRETVGAFCAVGAKPRILEPWRDVDEPADFDALVERCRILELTGQPLPSNTTVFLREHGYL